jgi:hypothetical protein
MRVSTSGNYQSALLDLMGSQLRSQEAQRRVSTQKQATDLVGFGRSSETLTALKSAQSRIAGFIDTGEAVAARLSGQNLALGRIADGSVGRDRRTRGRHVPDRRDCRHAAVWRPRILPESDPVDGPATAIGHRPQARHLPDRTPQPDHWCFNF